VNKKKVSEILKKSGIKIASPTERVDKVFVDLQSTHDAVFVFDKKDFKGVVNLYHSTLGKKINPQQKVGRRLYHPPVIDKNTPIVEAARLMVESRVYRLPITEKEKFVGAVFSEDILKWFKTAKQSKEAIEDLVEIKKPQTIDFRGTVDQALHLMIKTGQNRLLVTDKNGSLLGILTLYDLRKIITEPRRRLSFLTRSPIKKEFADQKVKNFYQRSIVSVFTSDPLKKAINLMVKNKVGSLVVFNKNKNGNPCGLITARGVLKVIAALAIEKKNVDLDSHFNKNNLKMVKKQIIQKLNRLLITNSLLANKVKSIKLDLKEIAKSNPQVRLPLMEITALVRLSSNNKVVWAKARGRRISLMVDEVVDRIKRVVRKQKDKEK